MPRMDPVERSFIEMIDQAFRTIDSLECVLVDVERAIECEKPVVPGPTRQHPDFAIRM